MSVINVLEEPPIAVAIPDSLIYEELNGRKLYRKGYKNVINHTKTKEEIMGSSSLQGSIIYVLLSYLYRHIEDKGYVFITNEIGLHISLGNNLSSDIIIYKKEDYTKYKVDEHYFNVAPKMVIEVDIKIDLEKISDIDYVTEKSQTLFGFGVERVIWFFTHNKKVLLATPGQDWIIRDWNKNIELMDGYEINLQELIEQKGILL